MNRGFTLFEMFVYLAVITMLVLIVRGIWISQTDPQAIAHREAAAYERAYPCINRIRYIRSLVQSAPHQVEACGTYQSTESGAE